MQQSKLVHLLKSLTSKELRWFERYIHSPYYNSNKEVILLFESIKNYYPEFNSGKLAQEKVFARMFPSQHFDYKKIRYIQSDLTLLLEKYIALKELEFEKHSNQQYLLKGYQKRQLDKYFNDSLKEISDELYKEEIKDSQFYLNQYLHGLIKHSFFSFRKDRSADSSLQQTVDSLDVFYLSTKLKYCCEILNTQNIAGKSYKIDLLDELLLFLKNSSYQNVPAIGIYYQILMTLLEGNNEFHYKQLVSLLEKNGKSFQSNEIRDMYAFAQNYCIKKINSGKSEYLSEIFSLYKILLQRDILLYNDVLPQWEYKNIVVTALRLNEFEWAQKFINEYKEKLRTEDRENAYNYNLAYLHFYKKEYRKTLKLLQSVEFTDVFYQLDSKTLLAKTYYEAGDVEPLYSMLASFKSYLKRSQLVSDYHNKAYSNLIKIVEKLAQLKFEKKGSFQKLKEEIMNMSPIADISWLTISLHEIEKGKSPSS